MRVYYFTKAGYGLEAIQRRRLKLARISALNDPFEFLQVASRNPKTRARYQYVKRALSEYMGLLCFSENWRNPVQWGHYADSHRGICLGFDVAPAAGLRKVRYVKSRIRPNLRAMKAMSKAAVEHMLDLLTLKFEHWQYEQEHRLFVQLNDKDEQSGLYFFDFGISEEVRLREVIVGAQSEISPEQVADVLGDIAPQVVSRKARLAFRTFEVVKQRRQDLWRPSRRRVGLREPSFEALVDQALRLEDFSKARGLIEPEAGKKSAQSETDELIARYAVADRMPSADNRSKKVSKRSKAMPVRKKR
jgi:Protein of unknown function (DUF2971)